MPIGPEAAQQIAQKIATNCSGAFQQVSDLLHGEFFDQIETLRQGLPLDKCLTVEEVERLSNFVKNRLVVETIKILLSPALSPVVMLTLTDLVPQILMYGDEFNGNLRSVAAALLDAAEAQVIAQFQAEELDRFKKIRALGSIELLQKQYKN